MSENKVPRSISLNRTNEIDKVILKEIEVPGFNFNGFAREAMYEKIIRERDKNLKIVKKNEGGGLRIIVGR